MATTAIASVAAAATTQPRVPNTTICLPICYGSIAFPLIKPEEYNTHKWTVYVRGPNNEDLSNGIAKVVFQLHPSFPQPVREVTTAPFEVTEKGWGEFEISIRIVWRDPSEKTLQLTHMLKLYPPLDVAASTTVGSKKESVENQKKDVPIEGEVRLDPVKSEVYDEVVFTDPTETFHRQLMQSTVSWDVPLAVSHDISVQRYMLPYSDEEDFKSLLEAQKFLENEMITVKDRILRAECSCYELDAALLEVVAKAKAIPVAPPPAPANSSSVTGTKRKKPSEGGSKKKSSSTKAKAASKTASFAETSVTAPSTTTAEATTATTASPTTNATISATTTTTTTTGSTDKPVDVATVASAVTTEPTPDEATSSAPNS